jgi:hypothetical protein
VRAGRLLRGGKRDVQVRLAALRREDPPAPLNDIPRPLAGYFSGLDRIHAIGAAGEDYGPEADRIANVTNRAREGMSRLGASVWNHRFGGQHQPES